MTHPTPNITTLLAATADLECGHPVEETASTSAWSAYHTKRAKTLLPCVLAIAEAMGISTHA